MGRVTGALSPSLSTAGHVVRNDAIKACLLARATVDCILTDPPYCLLFRRQKDGKLKNRSLSSRERPTFPQRYESVNAWREFTAHWVDSQLGCLRPSGILIIWMNRLGKTHVVDLCRSQGFHLLGEYLWAKAPRVHPANSTANEVNLRVYESALVFSRDKNAVPSGLGSGAAHMPICWSVITGYHEPLQSPTPPTAEDEREGRDGASIVHAANVDSVTAAEGPQNGVLSPQSHPHHKPFACLDPLIRTWTRPGDLVYDPFAGSGAILAAAARLGRNVIGGELDQQWVDVAAKYVQEAELEYRQMR